MIDLLVVVGFIGLTVQAFIGLSFFISCVLEKERRARVFALLQFTAILLLRKSGQNSSALEGTKGLIVSEVKQHDEREIVFARNSSLSHK